MSKNRVLYVLIVVALLAATAVSLRQAVSTKAAGVQADHSCNAVEHLCASRYVPATALKDGKCLDDECSYQLSNGQWVR